MSGSHLEPEDLPDPLSVVGPAERVCGRGHLARAGQTCRPCLAYLARRHRAACALLRYWRDNADVWGEL